MGKDGLRRLVDPNQGVDELLLDARQHLGVCRQARVRQVVDLALDVGHQHEAAAHDRRVFFQVEHGGNGEPRRAHVGEQTVLAADVVGRDDAVLGLDAHDPGDRPIGGLRRDEIALGREPAGETLDGDDALHPELGCAASGGPSPAGPAWRSAELAHPRPLAERASRGSSASAFGLRRRVAVAFAAEPPPHRGACAFAPSRAAPG